MRRDLPYLDSAGTDIQNLHVEYLTLCVCVCVCVSMRASDSRKPTGTKDGGFFHGGVSKGYGRVTDRHINPRGSPA